MLPVAISVGERQLRLSDTAVPLDLDDLLPGSGEWQVELGFGKGRYLQRLAERRPQDRVLGIEMASAYYRLVQNRVRRHGLENVVLVRGEALFLLSAALPQAFAAAVHVYFPDPWPKARHKKRRLFDAETVDLVLGLLREDGTLFFATDFLEYGAQVREILASHPAVELRIRDSIWKDGARTNYEAKYEREGRPIMRIEVVLRSRSAGQLLHPDGRKGVVAAPAQSRE